MRNLEDYEYRIDHLHRDGIMSCKLYNTLKERVGNMIGRKYEHETFLLEEIAEDINDDDYNKENDIRYEEKRVLRNRLNNHNNVIDGADYFDFLEALALIVK